jgi:hypothetical protein
VVSETRRNLAHELAQCLKTELNCRLGKSEAEVVLTYGKIISRPVAVNSFSSLLSARSEDLPALCTHRHRDCHPNGTSITTISQGGTLMSQRQQEAQVRKAVEVTYMH